MDGRIVAAASRLTKIFHVPGQGWFWSLSGEPTRGGGGYATLQEAQVAAAIWLLRNRPETLLGILGLKQADVLQASKALDPITASAVEPQGPADDVPSPEVPKPW